MGTQNRKFRNLPYMDGSLECIPGSSAGQQFFQRFLGHGNDVGNPQDPSLQNIYYQQNKGQ